MVSTLLAIETLNRRIELAETQAPPPRIEREEAYFRDRIGGVSDPEDLLEDFRLYRYVMDAFDMGEAVKNKALVQKVLEEGTDRQDALANRMADPKYRKLARELAFAEAGNLKLKLPKFIDDVAARYRRVQLELDAGKTNNAARLASYFERKIGDASSWYAVLGDKPMREVVFTALQLPDAMQTMDVDKLVGVLEERFSFEDFQDSGKRAGFIRRFAVFSDIGGGGGAQASGASAALSLLSRIETGGTNLLS